jgi:membrane protein YqaA with SNARE-associated domain
MNRHPLPRWLNHLLQFSANHQYYPLVVGLIAFASTVTFSFPFILVLIPAVLLAPRRWLMLGLICGITSGLGAAVLAELFKEVGLTFISTHFPELIESNVWVTASLWLQDYGLAALLVIAGSPMPQTPALLFCALADLPTAGILVAVGIGKSLKYTFSAWLTAKYPGRLNKFT